MRYPWKVRRWALVVGLVVITAVAVAGMQSHFAGQAHISRGRFRLIAKGTVPYAIESMMNGGLFSTDRNAFDNDTYIDTWHRTPGLAGQAWLIDVYSDGSIRFRADKANKCIDVYRSNVAGAGSRLVLWDCNDTNTQRWQIRSRLNGTAVLHSARWDLCLNQLGARKDPDRGEIGLWRCGDAPNGPNDVWLLTPYKA